MKTLTVSKVVDFTRKSDRGKQGFVKNLLHEDVKKSEGGGDYWVSCISSISNSYKNNNVEFINNKRFELEEKLEKTDFERTQNMYKANIAVLYKFENHNFRIEMPNKKLFFIKQHKCNQILTLKGLQLKTTPQLVYSFQNSDTEEIGAIWFVAKKDGYKKNELGMFTELLYKYLENNFSDDFILNPNFCFTVDVESTRSVSYTQLLNREVPWLLDKTISEIKKIMI